jgi:hypothetical protein
MKRDVIDIVKEKDFSALTAAERKELENLCETEDEYNHLKQVLLGVNAMDWSNPQPKNETKDRLDVLFAQTHPKAAGAWYSSTLTLLMPKDKPIHRQPLLQIAALALLVFLTVPFLTSNDLTENQVLVADNKLEQNENKEIESDQSSSDSEIEIPKSDELINDEIEGRVTPIVSEPSYDISSRGIPTVNGSVANNGSSETGSTHPDGVFIGTEAITYSMPASEQPEDLMDLLTATF